MNTPTIREQLISINRIVKSNTREAETKANDLYEQYIQGAVKMTEEEFDFLFQIIDRISSIRAEELTNADYAVLYDFCDFMNM